MLLTQGWFVDYGQGPQPVSLPHAWRQDVPVSWEGPAVYTCTFAVPSGLPWLVFEGVSYAAQVLINGELKTEHKGIWDAFWIDLSCWQGQEIELKVEVTKNGGDTYPVRETVAGFLPDVYHTFGGIFRPIRLVEREPTPGEPQVNVTVEGGKIFAFGQPFYARAPLTWGWYPHLGHPNPDIATLQDELEQMQHHGFNTVKFCLWMPPHEYLEEMHRRGLMAWLELPIWLPKREHLPAVEEELERIVLQYRHHPNILAWTVGCELGAAAGPEWRSQMVEKVQKLTQHPLVKDSSGGAEMYGGNPLDFGTFDDFHPYCDTPFFPVVLDSLLPGPRPARPILLGEFNDYDFCRDLRIPAQERPYWLSSDPALNAPGTRWQYDFPALLDGLADRSWLVENLEELTLSSQSQGEFMRDFVHQTVRAREDFSGYVVTGWRDTPISTAGFINDQDQPRLHPQSSLVWNSPDALFLLPRRSPPWVYGGNRPGWEDPLNHWAGDVLLQVGLHSEQGWHGQIAWQVVAGDLPIAAGHDEAAVAPLESRLILQIPLHIDRAVQAELRVQCDTTHRSWPLQFIDRLENDQFQITDPRGVFFDLAAGDAAPILSTDPLLVGRSPSTLHFLTDEGTLPRPFWREACYAFAPDLTELRSNWPLLLSVSGDRVLDPAWLEAFDHQRLITRVDTRTYEETCVAAVIQTKTGAEVATTLRPWGGMGAQPLGLTRNPAGALLIRSLSRYL